MLQITDASIGPQKPISSFIDMFELSTVVGVVGVESRNAMASERMLLDMVD